MLLCVTYEAHVLMYMHVPRKFLYHCGMLLHILLHFVLNVTWYHFTTTYK